MDKDRKARVALATALGLGLALVAAWLGVARGVGARGESVVPRVYLPVALRAHSAVKPPFGVQMDTTWSEAEAVEARQAGVQWVRRPFSWSSVEPINTTPAHYDWSGVDWIVSRVMSHDMDLILTLAGQPSWAATYVMGPVTDTAELLEFFGALVERYDGDGAADAPGSPVVEYWEIYNEPDNADLGYALHGAYGYWGHHGADYAALLRALYPVIKAANPRARLVVGGLALDWFEEQGGPFDAAFLDDMLAACQGHACFDVMNFHYYPPFAPVWAAYGPGIVGKTNYVRGKLAEYGFEDASVVCTETTWASGADWGSEELQARYVPKAYVRAMAAGLDILVWYAWRDGADGSLPGLLDNQLQPRPAYWAYWYMTENLEGAHYMGPLDAAQLGSDSLVGYVFSNGDRRIDVLWTEDGTPYDPEDDPEVVFAAQGQAVRVADRLGNESLLQDADDGQVDGTVAVLVGGSPVYVEYLR